MTYYYFNNVKLGTAKKKVKEKIAGIQSQITAKSQVLEVTEDVEKKKKLDKEIKVLENQIKNEEEMILEEYLKMNGRVEDEKGNKILSPHDKEIGEEKIGKREVRRKEYRESLPSLRRKG